ncbi:nitrate reductase catalytic subunit [Pleurocapsa sp. CCALA 161]|uniref:molybdopterin oxidoreductase family protein n=1 Tax=Pleurocapsa sp. CCALA 161 TaxID=2107688 RepID=UPI000D062030|nr:nitrate reductase [Pleurocapsa sp. CCALA 161]PSB11143.1 nitrate reductase catalytic subunit [Pleurocapsa sp. CCALA 161]
MSEPIKTLCPYCGVGCGLEVLPPAQLGKAINRDNQGTPLWQVRGDRSHPSSKGKVCVKGGTVAESLDKNRLKYPMMRDSLDQEFSRVSWDQALARITSQMQQIIQTQGADGICMYGSGQFQTEDYYIAQKLLKGCLGTNNFDANSRLCMSSAVAGYMQSFGSDGPPACYDDLELTDCAFLIGTNTADCHPIVYNRLRMHHKKNRKVKMIVVDPRQTKTAKDADLHLAIQPGTDIDLLNGIAHLLLRWGELDTFFIDECTQGFGQFVEVIQAYPPELVAHRCGIEVNQLEQAARYWADSSQVLSLWSMGVNQSSEGTAKVRTIINLHLMTGNIGKPGAGPFSLTGQPNAMGGREAGGLCHILPGYRTVTNPHHRQELEQAWQLPPGRINPLPGRDAWSMITGLETGDVGMLWVAATNPAVSMPDLVRTKQALLRSPFTVVQDAYYPLETASFAHVVLPAAQWGEKTGTMTNSERVVTLCSQFRPAPGEARPDWEIFAEVGRRLGFTQEFDFANSAEVYQEFVQLTQGRPCDMSGLTHGRLRQQGPIQWPCPLNEVTTTNSITLTCSTEKNIAQDQEEVKGLFSNLFRAKDETLAPKRLYTNGRFNTADGRAKFAALHSKGLAEPIDPDYPFVLTIGRLYEHWHTMTRTGRIEKIMKKQPRPFIEIHPKDARKLGIETEMMVEIQSRRGTGRFAARVTEAIAPGTVFVPMHWGALWTDNGEANLFTHPESCPISLQPELKACAVNLTLAKLKPETKSDGQTTFPKVIEKSLSIKS